MAALLIAAVSTRGALIINNLSVGNNTFTENFDSLGTGGGTWTDNSTLPNWYSSRNVITEAEGARANPGLYNLALGGTPLNRSLGSAGGAVFGLQLRNQAGQTITDIDISYFGRTWGAGAVVNRLTFEYFVGDPGFIDSEDAWVAASALNFSSTIEEATISAHIGNLNIADGQSFWFRWVDADSPGLDATMSIDDLSLTAVPEPGFYSVAAAGVMGLAIAAREWRARRKRDQGCPA